LSVNNSPAFDNKDLCDRVFGENKNRLTPEQKRRYYSNNDKALEAFLARKTAGLNLSDRVWKYTSQFKAEIEMGLDLGLREGMSAAEMAIDLKQYLQYPDKLFRRVRDQHGQLHLSKAAKAFHPGAGVYRSSYKNARRLAATENNIAYHTADHERWQRLDFVVGIEVRLSNNHTINGVPYTDMCDDLAGKYPKTFKFVGWHPLCRCNVLSILKSDEELMQENEAILEGREPDPHSVNEVKDVPDNFKKWIIKNQDRIEKAEKRGTLPYFIKDNKRYTDDVRSNKIQNGILIQKINIPKEDEKVIIKNISYISHKLDIFENQPLIMFSDNMNSGALMQYNGKTLTISTLEYNVDGHAYCPARELASAFSKMTTQQALSFLEEYSLENIYHEGIHSRSTGIVKITAFSIDEKIMESCTQLYAREKYTKILDIYNTKALHFDKIKYEGLGYHDKCNILRKHFEKDGQIQVGELINIANESVSGKDILIKKLKEKKMSKNEIRSFLDSLNI
jgi:hypothetical protein